MTADKKLSFLISKHWYLLFVVALGLYVGLPFIAPLFLEWGWVTPAKAIYAFYATQCHQMPQRSFFFFGSNAMYSLEEIQLAGQNVDAMKVLHRFVGNPDLGWKVAWSDRMVYMYASALAFSLLWRPLRKQLKNLSIWGFILFLLPLALDGTTHFISDFLSGFGQGFRYDNAWLAVLTRNSLPYDFYNGDGFGSFNSIMRLISGVSFGIGMVWFALPHMDDYAAEIMERHQKMNQLYEDQINRLAAKPLAAESNPFNE